MPQMLYDRAYNNFFCSGDVVEIRALGLSGRNPGWKGYARDDGVLFGYFDNSEDFSKAATILDKAGAYGIYFTLNPCQSALLARACNRLVVASKRRVLTSDANIKCIRWILIDIDPVRPSGISASIAEIEHAFELAKEVKFWLQKDFRFPECISAFSGNGYHLLWRLPDIVPDRKISGKNGLISKCLQVVDLKFGNQNVNIDRTVFNPARICKLYGTTARKGDDTEDRPHRRSYLSKSAPKQLEDLPILPIEKLDSLAGYLSKFENSRQANKLSTKESGQGASRSPIGKHNLGILNVLEYLQHYGIRVRGTKQHGDATLYLLEECLFDQSHRNGEAAIVASSTPPYLAYKCFHDSCSEKQWKDARAAISGEDRIANFYSNYSPMLKPSAKSGNGFIKSITIVPGKFNTPEVPDPDEIDPIEFHKDKGKRKAFCVDYMAKYLAAYLNPIVHTSGTFWKNDSGVWSPFSINRLNNYVHRALKDLIQTAWYKTSREALAAITNREEEEWPVFEDHIAFKNGVLNLETMEMLPHSPEFGNRTQVPTEYQPDAECKRWLHFCDEILEENEEQIFLLQEFLGYILLPSCRFEKAMFFYGTGANGKSAVLNVIEAMIGSNNISHLTLDDLSNRFQVRYLQGKMVNIAPEVETKERAGTEVLKAAISGDTLEGDQKYGERLKFRSNVKFIFALNSPPVISDKAFGFSRKVIVLNFNRRFSPEEMDRDLSKKLVAEKKGILAWAVAGANRLIKNDGFSLGASVQRDTDLFMATMNPLLIFLEECCIQGPDHRVPATTLYGHYKTWASDSGVRPLSKNRFYEQVISHCSYVKEKQRFDFEGSRPWGFVGIGIAP